jgi:hypothetical protein
MTAPFDPYAIEARYTLDYLGFLACRERPSVVHVATGEVDVALAVVRRLAPTGVELRVDTPEIADAVRRRLGVSVRPAGAGPADVALCPWLSGERLPNAPVVVGSVRNALSYKTLRSPGAVSTIAPLVFRRLGQRYVVRARAGFLPPTTVALLGLASLLRRVHPSYGYVLGDLATTRFFTTGWSWVLSYVVLFTAHRR